MAKIEGLWQDDEWLPASLDGEYFRMRNGREYVLSGTLLRVRPNVANEARAALTRHIDEHSEENPVFIFPEDVDRALSRPELPFSHRAQLLAREIVRRLGFRPGKFEFELSPHVPLFLDLLRSCYVESTAELVALLKYWAEQGVIEYEQTLEGTASVELPVRGIIALEDDIASVESQTAFVAMWFAPEMNTIYDQAIAPALEELGYIPIRIDRQEHNNKIDDEIIMEIRRARFLVSDFSCGEDGARGGVYFEAGFAAGLGKPVIYMVREANLAGVHFDTRQFNHIVWNTVEDLREKLRNRIGATIGAYASQN